jgi:hypothetical protein
MKSKDPGFAPQPGQTLKKGFKVMIITDDIFAAIFANYL